MNVLNREIQNVFFDDIFRKEVKIIDCNIYNKKWQEIINSLLQADYRKRMDINQVSEYF